MNTSTLISLIIVTPIYLFILYILTAMLVRDLKREKTEDLISEALILFNQKKYKIDKRGILAISKKKFPKKYWRGIVLRVLFVLLFLFVGYALYSKIF